MFATMSTKENVKHVTDIYGIPEDRIFNPRNTSFCSGIMRKTANKGVDVVLNSLSCELFIYPGYVSRNSEVSSKLENETFWVVGN